MVTDYQDVMKRIITGNESWINSYDPETDNQVAKYQAKNELKLKKPRKNKSKSR